MKLKKVAAICSRQGVFRLCDEVREGGEVRQWLGDGVALYPLDGLPLLDDDNLCTMFGITEKKRKKCSFRRVEVPEYLCLDDWEQGERCLHDDWPTVEYNGFVVKPLSTREGIVFIQNAYLAQLEDMADYLQLFERRTASGRTYIVAKNGLEITAVIMPMDTTKMGFVDKLEELARMCRLTVNAMEERERREQEARLAAIVDPGQKDLFENDQGGGGET